MSTPPPPERVVLRATNGYWITGVVAAIVVFFTVDALVRGDVAFALQALPWQLLILWVIYLLLLRPAIVMTPGQLVVINLLRRYVVPWTAVDRVGSRYQTVIYLLDDTRIVSWGAPATGLDRPSTSAGSDPSSTSLSMMRFRREPSRRQTTAATHTIVERVMRDWSARHIPAADVPATVLRQWDRVAIIVTIAIVILCAIDLAITTLVH